VTAFVGFATLILIPIPMIRELSITASIGVAYKIVTNLVMLPVVATYFRLGPDYVRRITHLREKREGLMWIFDYAADRRWAFGIVGIAAVVFGVAY